MNLAPNRIPGARLGMARAALLAAAIVLPSLVSTRTCGRPETE